MDLLKKHVDTVIVLGGIITSILWMNHKFTQVDDRFSALEKDMAILKAEINKDISVIKAVLIMQGHMPKELASNITLQEK